MNVWQGVCTTFFLLNACAFPAQINPIGFESQPTVQSNGYALEINTLKPLSTNGLKVLFQILKWHLLVLYKKKKIP